MVIKVDFESTIPEELGRVHFIGIGGSGMSGIARLMREQGIQVSGSDREDNYSITELREHGIQVWIGHEAAQVDGADTVVVTSALWPDNPELLRARELGLTILHRSQALAWLARGKRTIAVAGAHGKTTSTGMLVTALRNLGADPSFVNGGIISELGVSSAAGTSDLFIIEADESDGSFLLYDPTIALITNIDDDHLDHYGNLANFEAAFVQFANHVSELVVISSDDRMCQEISPRIDTPIFRFGLDGDADLSVSNIDLGAGRVSADFALNTGQSSHASLSVAGAHNAINAAGVVAVLLHLNFSMVDAVAAVQPFSGTKRRLDLHGTANGVRVFDDYAHHPTEVAAALKAARSIAGAGRLIAVEQPHLYSRTKRLHAEFAAVLEAEADYTVVLDVCGAREDPIPGVTGQLVVDDFISPSKVSYQPDWPRAAEKVAEIARPGDIVVTLGCGDVYRIIPSVLAELKVAEHDDRQHSDGGAP